MPTFVDLLNESQASKIQEPTLNLDNTSMFMPDAPSNAVRGSQAPFGQGLNCDGHSRVFVLWRPWTQCHRCMKSIEHDEVVLPDIGDYECPHTMNAEFEALLNKGLRGDVLLPVQEYFNLHNGTRCCHVVWLSLDVTATASKAKKQEVAETFSPIHSEIIAKQKELKLEESKKKEALEASEDEEIG